ncbi:MAG: hypothetical protein AVDCRST_MAG76-548, partial [uncultured Acidimicrobiales bacterium]
DGPDGRCDPGRAVAAGRTPLEPVARGLGAGQPLCRVDDPPRAGASLDAFHGERSCHGPRRGPSQEHRCCDGCNRAEDRRRTRPRGSPVHPRGQRILHLPSAGDAACGTSDGCGRPQRRHPVGARRRPSRLVVPVPPPAGAGLPHEPPGSCRLRAAPASARREAPGRGPGLAARWRRGRAREQPGVGHGGPWPGSRRSPSLGRGRRPPPSGPIRVGRVCPALM